MRNYIIFGIILIVIFIFLMKSDLFNFSDFDSQLSKIKKLMKNTKSSKRKSSSTSESSDISFNTDETKQTDDTKESDNTNETDETKSDISFDNSSEDIKLKNKQKFLQHLQKIAVKHNVKNGKNEKNGKNVKNGRNEKNNKDNNNQSKYKYNDDSSDDSIMELQKFAKQLSKKGNSIRSNNTDDTNGIQMTADDLTDTISGIISKELNRR